MQSSSLTLTLEQAVDLAARLYAQGQVVEADAICRKVLEADSNRPEALRLLGVIARDQRHFQQAIELLSRAVSAAPTNATYVNELGEVYRDSGALDRAEIAFHQAVSLAPKHAEGHYNLGTVLAQKQKLDLAAASYRQALALKPDFAEAHYKLGNCRGLAGEHDEAMHLYREAIRLKPDMIEPYVNLGTLLRQNGMIEEAIVNYRRALELRPDFAALYNNLGSALRDQGKVQEALTSFRQALDLQPGLLEAHSNLLLTAQSDAGCTPEELYRLAVMNPERFGVTAAQPPLADARRDRRLRIGFVSADFREHPVGFFLLPLLQACDRKQFELLCYANQRQQDGLTDRLRQTVDRWRSIVGMSDDEAASAVRSDAIDILFDLSGHTNGNRLGLFARKPAPIQVTWLGYSGTTGLRAIDYIIADSLVIPSGDERFFSEKPLRMPNAYLCFDGIEEGGNIAPLPSRQSRIVTFGSFNNIAKVTPEVIAAWSALLDRLPRSQLMIKSHGLGEAAVQARYRELFAQHGIAGERIRFAAWTGRRDAHLAVYKAIDIALDPFPYNGTTTTVEALWMGVPVVTMIGDRFAGRVGHSLLACAGLSDICVARSREDYIEKAIALGADLDALARIRAELRDRVRASPLCDIPSFCRTFEAALHSVWHARVPQ